MKENTPEQQLDLLCSQIIRERDHWNYINENGCNDPFWPNYPVPLQYGVTGCILPCGRSGSMSLF